MLRLTLVCVGKAKAGHERDLSARYIERARSSGRALGLAIDVRELDESRSRRVDDRKGEEAGTILAAVGPDAVIIALDESGRDVGSLDFAQMIRAARDNGVSAMAMIVGGPDGLDPVFRQKAAHVLAFGKMTWPHQLVRVMASEQIYRAVTVLAGHPYHRT